jgi:hypothetical protein
MKALITQGFFLPSQIKYLKNHDFFHMTSKLPSKHMTKII